MKSPIALIGGEEFADGFEDVHANLLELARPSGTRANGRPVRVVFLPTCASEDGPETVTYWCEEAQRRLGTLGAKVIAARVVDRTSADDPENARLIAEADWVYIGGGYPHVGMRILSGTRSLQALQAARQRGALIAGASAGAMMLGARSWVITPELDAAVTEIFSKGTGVSEWDLPLPPSLECLGFVPRSMCWPHANQLFSMKWLKNGLLPPGHFVIGIDEQTALVHTSTNGWEVLGRGKAILVDDRYQIRELPAGSQLESL
jgi:cyanophycinase